ncbi:MAG TPA: LytTR family DNA-binding domain-containing protein [Noviherbaspirillum sp.]|nr:LytTR family DNA-binding domain-containing protein [Noviherbaspirillum sp.]
MVTAVIADDEPHMREMLREELETFWPELEIIGEAEDGPSALTLIETRRPQVAFLDIRMPGLTGLQVAHAITVPCNVVFVTAYDAHARDAFKANAVDYVVKPLDPVELARITAKLKKATTDNTLADMRQLAAALSRLGAPDQPSVAEARPAPADGAARLEWLQIDAGTQIRMVHVDDVVYFESDTKLTRVVTQDCEGLIRLSLKQLTQQLDGERYLQIHRSTVVNRRFIKAIHHDGESMQVEMKGRPERLKVSQPNHHLFRAM